MNVDFQNMLEPGHEDFLNEPIDFNEVGNSQSSRKYLALYHTRLKKVLRITSHKHDEPKVDQHRNLTLDYLKNYFRKLTSNTVVGMNAKYIANQKRANL